MLKTYHINVSGKLLTKVKIQHHIIALKCNFMFDGLKLWKAGVSNITLRDNAFHARRFMF